MSGGLFHGEQPAVEPASCMLVLLMTCGLVRTGGISLFVLVLKGGCFGIKNFGVVFLVLQPNRCFFWFLFRRLFL